MTVKKCNIILFKKRENIVILAIRKTYKENCSFCSRSLNELKIAAVLSWNIKIIITENVAKGFPKKQLSIRKIKCFIMFIQLQKKN